MSRSTRTACRGRAARRPSPNVSASPSGTTVARWKDEGRCPRMAPRGRRTSTKATPERRELRGPRLPPAQGRLPPSPLCGGGVEEDHVSVRILDEGVPRSFALEELDLVGAQTVRL